MAVMDRPRQVVFNLLKQTWGIEHQETLSIIGTDYTAQKYSDEHKHARSRDVVNIEPEKYYPGMFRPFGQSAATLISRMHCARRGPVFNGEIIEYMTGEPTELMRSALDRYNLNGALFSNTMTDIAWDERLSETDKAHLLVLLFCAAGCTGDVREAVNETLDANRSMGARFVTTQKADNAEHESAPTIYNFALLRIDSGGQGGRYILSTEPAGTEIGRQTTSASAITDVDMAVSKRHVHIWRDENSTWWVEGLGSTNGTYLIDAVTRENIVVEPPQDERLRANLTGAPTASAPVELHLGDILVLADTTQFWVQAV